jgi:hypothetical protein
MNSTSVLSVAKFSSFFLHRTFSKFVKETDAGDELRIKQFWRQLT